MILPGAPYEDFVEFMDLDAIVLVDKTDWRYETLDAAKKIMRDQWGGIARFTSEDVGHPMEPALKVEKELDNYAPPDPDLPWRYERFEKWVRRFKGQRALIAHVIDVFDIAKENLLGDVEYFKSMLRNPDLIDRVNEMSLTII